MSQKAIEVILARQFAGSLALPVFIVDPDGSLLFYNEPAEAILGLRFEETGEMDASEWSRVFVPSEEDGSPLMPESLPLMVAVSEQRPTLRRMWINGLDNVRRHIEVFAFPLTGMAQRHLGAVAIFWEVKG